jgi:hypothetical protein
MVRAKPFDFRIHGFQNATISLLLLAWSLLCVSTLSGCAGTTHRSRTDTSGLILVETQGLRTALLQPIAKALLRQMRDDRLRVASYPQNYVTQVSASPSTGLKQANATLKRAWKAYYQMRLDEAWQLAQLEMIEVPVSTPDGLRARLLAALIRFAEGRRTAARGLLQEMHRHWPMLTLSESFYPPKFIALYEQVERAPAKKTSGPRFVLAADRPLMALRRPARHLAEARQWQQVWLLRIIPQATQSRAELQQISNHGKRLTRFRSVRFGTQATPDKVAAVLWQGSEAI